MWRADMKTGRNIHVPKSAQMKQNYRRYIDTLDYQPTVDERLDFNQTSQSGEELSPVETSNKRPSNIGEKVKDHFSNNWLIWVLAALAAGILYLISDSKVAFTKFETMLSNQNEKLNELKNAEIEIQKNDRSQDLKVQENSILLNQIKSDIFRTETKIKELMDSQQRQ